MKTHQKLAALATAATLLGTSATVMADYDPAQYDYAQVLSSRPIVDYVTVKTPVRECWEEMQYYTVDRHAGNRAGSTLFGAILGGVIGHQFGSGRGNDAATIAGGLIGAAIGNDAAAKKHPRGAEQHARPVERCKTTYRSQREERISGYQVTYRYNGQKYRTEMPYDPGNKIRVRVDVRPAN